MAANILIIEDTQSLALLYQNYLIPTGVKTSVATTGSAGKARLLAETFDLVLLDVMLPDADGMDILQWMNEQGLSSKVIIMTAHGTKELVMQSIRLGAADFVEKPIEADRLRVTINNALKLTQLEKQVEAYSSSEEKNDFCGMVGRSAVMRSTFQIIENAEPSKASVFITGESGTGKELCASAIHQCSQRKGDFVALNCAAIPKDLIESEIFGHVKGAFTGATSNREGAAGLANGGTLFFDEIGEMDLKLQSKLLRFIQTGTFQKVGSEKVEQVDVRFVCATNRDPWEEVQTGTFREDLYYRLHVLPIHLPPLRERENDVIDIANKMFAKAAKDEDKSFERLSIGAEALIRNYSWPGNIRQLENTIRNVVVLNPGPIFDETMFPPLREKNVQGERVAPAPQSAAPVTNPSFHHDITPNLSSNISSITEIEPMWQVEKRYIEEAIAVCNGNVSKAAAALEINPSTIYRKMKDW